MKCAHEDCQNDARYVDQHGKLVCGICPIKAGDYSIKIADIPRLLAWAFDYLNVDSALDAGESVPPSMHGPMAARG